jgi:uncharacterized protein YggE
MKIQALVLGTALLAPQYVHAQSTNAPLVPQIVLTGHGEVKLPSDRATIQIAVQTRAATASDAAAQNATKQQAVLTALRALGLTNDQLSTVNYQVYPEQRYEQGKDPVITGYNVTNTVVADIRRLDLVGKVIDAALSHGANVISSLQFYSSNTEAGRRTAIGNAIAAARGDAEAAARAAGGSLGELIEINVISFTAPQPIMARQSMLAADAAQTPINPGQETLSVEVATRWRLLPGAR